MLRSLHDGRRCSLCGGRFLDSQIILQLPAEREYSVIDDEKGSVHVLMHAQCAVNSEEH